jgi:ATP-dependent Clp protease ATP-binding subunit ClpC
MNLSIPLLVQEARRAGSAVPVFVVRPLFMTGPTGQGEHLSRATSKLAMAVRKRLDLLGKSPRHDALLPWTFSPTVHERRLKAKLTLRRGTADCSTLVVWFGALGRRLAMMPALPDRWFEVVRGQDVLDRAAEVLTDHLNEVQRESDKFVLPEPFTSKVKQWISSLELTVTPGPELERPAESLMALLGGGGKPSGRVELEKVGRCLDWLYPDELDRAALREAEVAELDRLLSAPDRRPVLLLGPPQVGKTAVIHDAVRRRVERATSPHANRHNVWLLSPPRLISGMMFVGQWEGRVTAIVEEAIKRDHVLYFDDVLGLHAAGRSRDADLTVADVLRPYVERRAFRMLAEMTPEAFRVLQERDRGLADQFHVLPVRPTTVGQTRQVLFEVRRQLEGRHRCRLGLDVLPTVLDLTDRYGRDAAQPGKAAELLRQLAAKRAGQDVGRADVLTEFRDRSGLSVEFLDDAARLRREQVVDTLRETIAGQDEAVAAMADAVCVAKARLNDPGRPLATFLFLGPTGVGKTECAKALCAHLFGDARRLLRFDLNEYVDPSSPARLIGTFDQPEGLLTAAIRRQPFSVVLLDEIEKGHPGVFDLLLQLLGEGRLTDSLGRTADFGNAIVIMTSNLGTRAGAAGFGLRPAGRSNRDTYVAAAEGFFRPEFFNRIDRIVPFEPLTREQVAGIAQRLMGELLRRDGLLHRQCVLSVDPAAMERVIDQGFHPELGARALKRSLERQLTRPVAARLAAAPTGAAAVIRLLPAVDGITVRVDPLTHAERNPPVDLGDWAGVLDDVEAAVGRIGATTADLEPAGGLTQGMLAPAHYRYLAVRELTERVLQTVAEIDRSASAPALPRGRARPSVRSASRPVRKMLAMSEGDVRLALRAAADLQSHLAALDLQPPPFGDSLADKLLDLLGQAAVLQAVAASANGDGTCLVWLRSPNPDATAELAAVAKLYGSLFGQDFGYTVSEVAADPTQRALRLDMPGIARLMVAERGTHLFSGWGRNAVVVQVIVTPTGDRDAATVLAAQQAAERSWHRDPNGVDPFPLGPVVRVYDGAGLTVDVRSGLAVRGLPSADDVRRFLVAQVRASAAAGEGK